MSTVGEHLKTFLAHEFRSIADPDERIQLWASQSGIPVPRIRAWLDGQPVETPRRGLVTKLTHFDFKQIDLEAAQAWLTEHDVKLHARVASCLDVKTYMDLLSETKTRVNWRDMQRLTGLHCSAWSAYNLAKRSPDAIGFVIVLVGISEVLEAYDARTLKNRLKAAAVNSSEILVQKELTFDDLERWVQARGGLFQGRPKPAPARTASSKRVAPPTENTARPPALPSAPTGNLERNQRTAALTVLQASVVNCEVALGHGSGVEQVSLAREEQRSLVISFARVGDLVMKAGLTEKEISEILRGQPMDQRALRRLLG